MDILRDKEGRSNIRLIVLVFVVLSGIAAALLYFPPIPTKTEPEKTSGDMTFTDGAGNPLSGSIELRGDGVSSGLKPNVNYISWTNVPNARIYYNALDTKDVSVNLRISGDSPKGKVMLESYGIGMPSIVNVSAPGSVIKYVEVSAIGVSFAEAEFSIKYTDAELNGLDEKDLVIYRYDSTAQAWSELPTKVDADNNILSTTVNSLSIFAVSTRIPEKIEVRDTMRAPVVSDIKTYDEAKNVKKAEKASTLSAADIPLRGELEVDALKTKSVAVKLKVRTPSSGEIILDDYGRKNPVAVAPPGTTIKYVDISAVNINFDSAEVRIAYTNAELGGADENTLTIYHWNGAFWEALPTTIDAANNILTAATTSLSPFAAADPTYYLHNLQKNVGAAGTQRIMNTTSPPAGPASSISAGTISGGTAGYTSVANFYTDPAYSSEINISSFITVKLWLQNSGSGQGSARWNVTLYDYNSTSGSLIFIGNSTYDQPGGGAIQKLSYLIPRPTWNLTANHRIRLYLSVSAQWSTEDITPILYYDNTTYDSLMSFASPSIDTTPPTITFIPPTPENGSATGYNWVFVNTSLNEAGKNATLWWNGTNITMSNSTATNWFYNKTALTEGNYTYKVYATDLSNNTGISETRVVRVWFKCLGNSTPLQPHLISPADGNVYGGIINISWLASTDPEGDPITYYIYYSRDNGTTWQTLATGISSLNYSWDTHTIDGTGQAKVRIKAFDGCTFSPAEENDKVFGINNGRLRIGINRYVILDDPKTGTPTSEFPNPVYNWATDNWKLENTTIRVYAILLNTSGMAAQGINVNFTLINPGGAEVNTTTKTTDATGQANASFNMNAKNYYGIWTIRANATLVDHTLNHSRTFIYNWWGCGSCHNAEGISKIVTPNSPYMRGYDYVHVSNNKHLETVQANSCTMCHQSYGDASGYTNDFHSGKKRCQDCHTYSFTLKTGNGIPTMPSCYDCHPTNNNKLTTFYTLENTSKDSDGNNRTRYSDTPPKPSGNPMKAHKNATNVPCLICHNTMHNITKTDPSPTNTNNYTEYTQCEECHTDRLPHGGKVADDSCNICHSQDAHKIRFSTGSGNYSTNKSEHGDCTTCHQTLTNWKNLFNQSIVGPYPGRDPKQIRNPVNHSDDPISGQKWNKTATPYWTSQLSSCITCKTEKYHESTALGREKYWKGNLVVNSTINSGQWCASCHYQEYKNGSGSYIDMVKAFENDNLPVPPEITGNATYKPNSTANDEKTGYYNHSLGDYSDLTCKSCHNSKLSDTDSITLFMHNVTMGGGGADCISCHNIGGSAGAGRLVNFTSVNSSMHANLNKNATGNATNKPCWACHGTKNGTWANESDQPLSSHNETVYKNPRKCYDCHNDTSPLFTARNVTDHIPSGLSVNTDVNTSSYNNTYCSYCHNNSVGASFDPDGLGLSGGSPGNASVSHYGANKTKGMLMNATSNSTDCVYCHRNSSNMLTWGILSNTLANISNKNATGGGTSHDTYTASTQCSACHGGYTVTPSFTFHNSDMGSGSAGGVNCTSCHNVGGTVTGKLVNFTSVNSSMHANLNRNATGNATNKPCWACHGTKNGTWANETDQPASSHNETVYNNPRNCEACHNDTWQQFTARNVTDHIPSGLSVNTDVNTSSYNNTYCSYCHNNSVGASFDPDGLGLSGGSPGNASVSHYGANKTRGMLMNATSNSTDCVYCHRNSSNMLTWGILSNTLANISNKNGTSGTGTNHNSYTASSDCKTCHGSYTVTAGFTFHNTTLGSGGDCKGCHSNYDFMNSSGKPARYVNSTMFNNSPHGGLRCEDCHTKGHNNIGARKACENCHAYQSDPRNETDRHNITRKPSTYIYNGVSIVNITDCTTCHNSTLYNKAVETYGYGKAVDCDYCHTYPDKTYS